MNVGANIRRIRKERGYTLNQLATLIESDVGNLSRVERGVQGFTEPLLNKLSTALGVPASAFFIDDDADLRFLFPGARPVAVVEDSELSQYRIPRVELRLQAGVTGFQAEPDRRDGGTMGLSRSWVDRKGYDPAKLLSIQVRGESMEPTFYEDDIVVLNLADTKPVDNGVFAVNYNGEAVIKRMSRDAGQWWLMSDNPDQRKFYRRVCQGVECIIIGRVVRREGDHF